ncbi:MAG: type I restriction endonuclease subunit S [Methylomarinum sp.]|nr:type I restriction endonuclease subunit S [Methylomarinum sp.]
MLEQVDTIKSRLDNIPEILNRFRQSVLADAVSGKLTANWRKTNLSSQFLVDQPAINEFRGKKLSILPEKWQWLKFDQVAVVASSLQDPLLTPDAIHIAPNHIQSGTGQLLEYTTILEDKVTSAKHRFYSGQILYSKIRPYLCKVVRADFTGLCSADMYPINSKINTQFLFRWMLSNQFTDWASNGESRSVLPKINQKDLGKIPVPTPPLKEQTEIVTQVEKLFTYADKIEQQVKEAQTRVDNLTQSILAKAFRGELTADWRAENPDLISGENSAAALLARIKAEREKLAPAKKIRKKSKV